ncbi:hypothetical protein ES708_25431 [subsurface metagenome]
MAQTKQTEKIRKLQNLIIDQQIEAKQREDLIDALQIALAARDKLAMEAIDDLTQEKKVNLRWEKFAHDAMAQQAKLLKTLAAAGVNGGREG